MSVTRYTEWSGGMQNRTSRFLQQPNEWDVLLNGHTDEVGATNKRPGFKRVGTAAVDSTKSIQSLDTAGQYIYALSSTPILKYNDSPTTPVSGTWQTVTVNNVALVANTYAVFVPFAEIKAFIMCGAKAPAVKTPLAVGDFNETKTATYAAPSPVARMTNAPMSRWGIRYRDRLYHGYCAPSPTWTGATWFNEANTVVKPNRIVFSNTPAAGAITYEDQGITGYLNFLDMDDDNTGLAVNSDKLLAFTPGATWIREGDATLTWKKMYSIGCDSGFTVKNLDIYTLFFNRNGIYAYSGGKPQKISNKIQPIIDSIISPAATFAACPDDDHYRLWVGTLTIRGKTFKNCLIQYTLSTNAFSIYSYRVPMTVNDTWTSFGTFNDGTKTRMYAGTSSGEVHILAEPGDTTLVYSDGDQASQTQPITFWARTPKFDHNLPEEMKDTDRIVIFSEQAQGTLVNVIADTVQSDSQPRNLGQIHREVEVLTVNPHTAYWHQYEFIESSTNASLKINGFALQHQQSTQLIDKQ